MNPFCYIRSMLPVMVIVATAACNDPTAPLILKGSRVTVANQLLAPIAIRVNGIDMGRVEPQTNRTIQRGNLPLAVVEWSLIRPQQNGVALGDSMGGIVSRQLPGDDDVVELPISNPIGDGIDAVAFFAPVISNTSNLPIEIGINMGTSAERRTDLIIPPGTTARFIGYYRLTPNSNVRAYSPEVAYSPFLFIERRFGLDFNLFSIDPLSGSLPILFDQGPP
jgi:hypothetical protein